MLLPGGETIKNIKEQSRAHVELQRNPPPNTDPNVRIFSIRGTPQQLEKARQLIDERIGVGGPPLCLAPGIHERTCRVRLLLLVLLLVAGRVSPGVKCEESIKWT